ncbi:hypothetical protein PMKS-004010 [Pichia membranifaciens]|uniref:Uncharacterized protein n=1 Tax=Pichia membranifaciens TaxID=4926 RepID=A0A1Q2YLQ6_9ASCO|nr:hypothetical protein PMKS-004010 [Pichia membranifaciens]
MGLLPPAFAKVDEAARGVHDAQTDDGKGYVGVLCARAFQPGGAGEGEDAADDVVDESDADKHLESELPVSVHDVQHGEVGRGGEHVRDEGQTDVEDSPVHVPRDAEAEHEQADGADCAGQEGKVESELAFDNPAILSGHPENEVIRHGPGIQAPDDAADDAGDVVDPVTVLGVIERVFLKEKQHDQDECSRRYRPGPADPAERLVKGNVVGTKRSKISAQRVRQVVYCDDSAQLVAEEDAGEAELDVCVGTPEGEPGQHLRAVRVAALVNQGVPDRAEEGKHGAKQNNALAAKKIVERAVQPGGDGDADKQHAR